jgi:hypothetical protein
MLRLPDFRAIVTCRCVGTQTKKINMLCGHNAEFIVLNWRYLYSVPESNELKQRIIYCSSARYVLYIYTEVLYIDNDRFRYAQMGTEHVSDLSCS